MPVPWNSFPPALKKLIDEEEAAGNVEALDEYRKVWQASNVTPTAKRLLIGYIDSAQRQAATNRERWDDALH